MDISNLSKFPSNTRGYTVIPCFPLTPDNMHESLLGLMVTIGLGSTEKYVTDQGQLVGYDDKHLKIKVGAKTKKLEYDPVSIQLQVYQFSHKILFANNIPDKELAQSQEQQYDESHRSSDDEASSIEFTKPKKEPEKKQRKPRKKQAPKASSASNAKKPMFGIQRG